MVLLWGRAQLDVSGDPQPTELFFPGRRHALEDTLRDVARLRPAFRADSTETITPDLLAALAQVEGEGTLWRGRTGSGT